MLCRLCPPIPLAAGAAFRRRGPSAPDREAIPRRRGRGRNGCNPAVPVSNFGIVPVGRGWGPVAAPVQSQQEVNLARGAVGSGQRATARILSCTPPRAAWLAAGSEAVTGSPSFRRAPGGGAHARRRGAFSFVRTGTTPGNIGREVAEAGRGSGPRRPGRPSPRTALLSMAAASLSWGIMPQSAP